MSDWMVVTMDWRGLGTNFRDLIYGNYYSGLCLEGLPKITKSQNSWCLCSYLNCDILTNKLTNK
jgi:hypothetical protein